MGTDLRTIPYVGKEIKKDLQKIGISCVEDLKDKNPEELFKKHNERKGIQDDRCLLYVFRMAVYFASNEIHDENKLKWWIGRTNRLIWL